MKDNYKCKIIIPKEIHSNYEIKTKQFLKIIKIKNLLKVYKF